MAANKKSSTSKTARVMNLLSKNREEIQEPEVTTAAAEQAPQPSAPANAPAAPVVSAAPEAPVAAAPAPAPHPSTPPLISSMQADSAISDQVLSALESALDDELRAEPSVDTPAETVEAPAPETQADPDPVVEEPVSEPANETNIVSDPVAEAITQITEAEEAVVEASESPMIHIAESTPAEKERDTEPHPPTRFPVDAGTIYVNVMESLVEDKAMKYIDLFGLCKCPRCVADVKAFALNKLEPKYVVMQTGDVIPRITLYEGQFAAAVTSKLLNACKIVMEHPRHDR